MSINDSQMTILKDLAKNGGNVDVTGYDLRTIKALVRRDFAKLISNKKGQFVKVTAKGKKAIN